MPRHEDCDYRTDVLTFPTPSLNGGNLQRHHVMTTRHVRRDAAMSAARRSGCQL